MAAKDQEQEDKRNKLNAFNHLQQHLKPQQYKRHKSRVRGNRMHDDSAAQGHVDEDPELLPRPLNLPLLLLRIFPQRDLRGEEQMPEPSQAEAGHKLCILSFHT